VFQTDNGGFAFSCKDLKILSGSSTWATRLSQLARMSGVVRIATYSLPDLDYVAVQLGRRPCNIEIVCHAKFEDRAAAIKARFPDIRLFVNHEVHAKMLLIEPHTVFIGSANFGSSGWAEVTFGAHSVEAHGYAVSVFETLKSVAREVGAAEVRI
jgi:hypothetical protein